MEATFLFLKILSIGIIICHLVHIKMNLAVDPLEHHQGPPDPTLRTCDLNMSSLKYMGPLLFLCNQLSFAYFKHLRCLDSWPMKKLEATE